MSGFLKEDCIKPVITLVIHFGAEEWDGPLSLHEMMSVSDIEILSFVENYRIHLIEVSEEEGEIEMCKAIEDLIAESEARGRAEGEVRGEARGRAEGETRGEAKGMIEICLDMSFSKEDILKKLQEKLNISLQQAGEYFEMYGKRTV